jgi:hypothetical protein
MNPEERDELLIRLDERTKVIKKLNEQQDAKLILLNGQVLQNSQRIADNVYQIGNIKDRLSEGMPLKVTRGQYATGGAGLVGLLIPILVAVGRILGWW